MDKNISFGYTLEKYNKKYGKHRDKLLKYSKKDIEDFDKKYGHYEFNGKTHSLEYKNYLLKNRKWALIDDTYYEIPTFKTYFLAWWILLPAAGHIAFASVTTAAVTSAVVFPTLAATGVFHKGGTTPEPVPEKFDPVEFETCTWTDISKRCTSFEDGKLTEDDFLKLFTFNDVPASSFDDFIGKERTVSINSKEHTVRIIGTNHDYINATKKAAFTFEFEQVISGSDGNKVIQKWSNSATEATYNTSTIRTDLNSNIKNLLPSDLKSAIKPVKKKTSEGNRSTTVREYDESLFVLSLHEMASESGITNSYHTTIKNFATVFNQEGNQYKYYQDKLGDSDPYKWNESYSGITTKKDVKGTATTYWLRTPCIHDDKSGVYYAFVISNSPAGYCAPQNVTYNIAGVAPAFCL